MEELNSGPPKTNPSSGREEDLNRGSPDYKSSALPLGHARPPDFSKHLCANFNCKFESMLWAVSAENKECILLGDINCNYLVSSDHKEIKSILTDLGLKQLISSPTRITCESKTLIDVICSNVLHNIFSVKVIPAGLSDHELIGLCSQAEQC